ncbi:MFS transporter [Thermostilla marina]
MPTRSRPDNSAGGSYVAWRSTDYRYYAVSLFARAFSRQIEMVTLGVYVYDRTSDPLSLGWLGLVQAVPMILFALAGGHLADRFSRKLIMLITFACQTGITIGLILTVLADGPLFWLYACLAAASFCQALGTPARAAILPQLVPARDFSNAVMWNSSIFQLATMTGPAVGGLLLGETKSFVNALSVVLVCRAVMTLSTLLLHPQPTQAPIDSSGSDDFWAGLGFLWKRKTILAAISLDMFAVLMGGVTYLLPVFAEDILKVGATGLGFLRSAEAVGAVFMAMLLAHAPPMRRAGRNMLLAVVGFGLATVVFGLSRSFPLSLAMMFLIGAFDNISVVVRHTLVQSLTPDSMRGRVSAVNTIFIVVSNDLGGLESGVTARLFGPVGSVLLGGFGAIAAVIVIARVWPQLAKIGRLDELTPESVD